MVNINNITEIKWLKDEEAEYIIDPLTEIITRKFIVKIAEGLIEDKTPFTLMILDLDNFKQINDSYGHLSGDFILKSVGKALIEKFGEKVYIGRYGGDEIILLIPEIVDYDEVHIFLEKLFEKNKIFRRYYSENGRDIYLTATLGCARYPMDATDYETLFKKADKALYRGKTKGRNCYIIYIEEKHKDIIVHEKVQGSLVEHLNAVIRLFDIYKGESIIKNTLDFLYSELHCSGVCYVNSFNEIASHKTGTFKPSRINFPKHLEKILKTDKVFYASPLTKYKQKDKELNDYLTEKSIQSIMVVKIETFSEFYGYIIVYEKEITRVWQENEVALVMYVAALLELQMKQLK